MDNSDLIVIVNLLLIFSKCEKSDEVHSMNSTTDKRISLLLCKKQRPKKKASFPLALPTAAR